MKLLKSQKNERARKRFKREVAAYETLSGDGIAELIEHNSDQWEDPSVGLYMVLELIDGVDLDDYVRSNGPLSVDLAFSLVGSLAQTLAVCHAEGVVHRDVKPANIMLRDSDPARPVLVDFGLSFNLVPEPDDMTDLGDEVGNRFLRLPEQAFDTRGVWSDISRLAGVTLFCLTGVEPRSLLDGANKMPHQREDELMVLREKFDGVQLMRLLSVLDKAFAVSIEDRFSSIDAYLSVLENVRVSVPVDADEALDAKVTALVDQASAVQFRNDRAVLQPLINRVGAILHALSKTLKGIVTQTNSESDFGSPVPSAEITYGLSLRFPPTLVRYRFTKIGSDVLLEIDEASVWRSSIQSATEVDALIERAAKASLVRGESPESPQTLLT